MARFLAELSSDAELVLAAIERDLLGRSPTPSLLDDLAPRYRDVIPGHIVTIRALPRLPGGRRRAVARYELIIEGPRIDGKWTFSNGWLIRYIEELRQAGKRAV